ncbi:MAG TPA: phytanoyl-CoA dioxygenase family protein, partial [Enhygromyxa sp.]|nr:phytanoyl-CoA dioxygenase family protein [Enhygromyxa sp.]
MGLPADRRETFIEQGYLRIDDAFPRSVAAQAVEILARDIAGFDDPSSWTEPVVRLGERTEEPFVAAANTDVLHAAFDLLVGEGQWLPRRSLGSFPIRFPCAKPPIDDGWHIDTSFPGSDPNDYFSWRSNVHSRGRALTMLFLFTDVGEHDAPTRLKAGSHLDVARTLEPHADQGLAFMEIAQQLGAALDRPTHLAVGAAGTVYLCHPFLVHAARAHSGRTPKIMAQPPLFPAGPHPDSSPAPTSAVAQAIRRALGVGLLLGIITATSACASTAASKARVYEPQDPHAVGIPAPFQQFDEAAELAAAVAVLGAAGLDVSAFNGSVFVEGSSTAILVGAPLLQEQADGSFAIQASERTWGWEVRTPIEQMQLAFGVAEWSWSTDELATLVVGPMTGSSTHLSCEGGGSPEPEGVYYEPGPYDPGPRGRLYEVEPTLYVLPKRE